MREQNIHLKTSLEVERMRRPARLVESILSSLEDLMEEGVTTGDIAAFCSKRIEAGWAASSAKGYKGFPATICTSLNNVAVHGIPGDVSLRTGDILTVDISLNIDGWHGDSARTYVVGTGSEDIMRLQKAARAATEAGIRAARAGKRIGDIGWSIEKTARRWGCSVIEAFAGHGIGLELHEDPLVLPTGEKSTGIPIVPGMVFTIEPVLTLGCGTVTPLGDGWSFITADGSFAAQYEHTVAIFSSRTEVLTDSSLTFHFS